MQNIYQFEDYKSYLKAESESGAKAGRGFRQAIAKAARCQSGYITQVLNGRAELSLEQAEGISDFLNHSTHEGHFFILLVQYSRAGTPRLKRYFREQMREALRSQFKLAGRIDPVRSLDENDQTTYYGAWYFSAIHILLTIKEFRDPAIIAKRLSLPKKTVKDVLSFLVSTGLARFESGEYSPGETRIHLPSHSPMIGRHHQNWRLKAIDSLELANEDSIHYSSIVSLSKKDVSAIQETLLQTIKKAKAKIKDSKEELLFSFCMDFYELPLINQD